MKMKRVLLACVLLLLTLCVGAAGFNKATYYSAANNTCGATLKTKMRTIINGYCDGSKFSQISYGSGYLNGVWGAFVTTDCRPGTTTIIDRYSNITSFTVGDDQAGNYKREGDVYNREHSFPKSWFGGSTSAGAGTDLFHVYPTDGYVNNQRGDYPFGEVANPTYSSAGGYSKLGPCSYPGYAGKVFEPNDEWKGDFARSYFYMVTCYESDIVGWYNSYSSSTYVDEVLDGTTYPAFKTWYLNMMLKWAQNDPVDAIEIARNEAVMAKQHNRNPFIDFPGLEQYIWGTLKTTNVSISNYVDPYNGTPPTPTPSITLSPTSASVVVNSTVALTATTQNANGASVTWLSSNTSVATISNGVVTGVAAGTATITASIEVSGTTYSATCVVTVTSGGTTIEGDYVKVTSAPADWSGTYLIVYEGGGKAFNGQLETLDIAGNVISVTINDNKIESNKTTDAAIFVIERFGTDYKIKSNSGYYIGRNSAKNGMDVSGSPLTNSIALNGTDVEITGSGRYCLSFNTDEMSGNRFRYYAKGKQSAIQLYKKVVTETPPVLLGDVNKDGEITIADVTALVNIILGKDNGPEPLYNQEAADVNGDGGITIADVTALVNMILGKN